MDEKLQRPTGGAEFVLRFHADHPRQLRLASLVHALDAWNQVELVEVRPAKGAADTPRMQLITSDGRVLTGYGLFCRLTRTLRLLWPLALLTWVPGMGVLAQRWFPALDRSDRPHAGSRASHENGQA